MRRKELCPRLCFWVPTEPDERCDGDYLALPSAKEAGTMLSRGKRFGRTCRESAPAEALDIRLIRRLRQLERRRWVVPSGRSASSAVIRRACAERRSAPPCWRVPLGVLVAEGAPLVGRGLSRGSCVFGCGASTDHDPSTPLKVTRAREWCDTQSKGGDTTCRCDRGLWPGKAEVDALDE
jgi:hypothetical protein